MTVAELIEELNKLPPDMLVMVPGYEGGYDNAEVQRNTAVLLNDNWDGLEKKNLLIALQLGEENESR